MAEDDFSFPATGETFSCGFDSPPLWNLSPAASPNHYHGDSTEKDGFIGKSSRERIGEEEEEEEEEEENCNLPNRTRIRWQRKSFSYIENGPKRMKDYDHDDHEDAGDDGDNNKMDSLWENLNDEQVSSRTGSVTSSSRDSIELGCLQSLAVSRARRLPTKHKQSMIAIVKILRKLFLLHNPQYKTS